MERSNEPVKRSDGRIVSEKSCCKGSSISHLWSTDRPEEPVIVITQEYTCCAEIRAPIWPLNPFIQQV
jgi:hypothetical protein